MTFQENTSLQAYNTFGIPVNARYLSTFSTIEELKWCIQNNPTDATIILGGGSNVLFTKEVEASVLLNRIKGIKIEKETTEHIYIRVNSGEIWHEFVLTAIKNNWCGIENLSLIPGNVGASPMQNIGAYGVEIKDVFDHLEAYELSTGKIHSFSTDDCAFGYRESVFKNTLKGQFVITSVCFKLSKTPNVSTQYGAIEEKLAEMGIKNPGITDVSNAVIAIRQSKLPNPQTLGNAGSFFKNPIVPIAVANWLKEKYPNAPVYVLNQQEAKLAAGWLIEQSGWKGKQVGNCGVHKLQALVLVNYGDATGDEIWNLSEAIIQSVQLKFGVVLEREVNIYR
jgi:UDP-N-acetylmuramate dehydrogenase